MLNKIPQNQRSDFGRVALVKGKTRIKQVIGCLSRLGGKGFHCTLGLAFLFECLIASPTNLYDGANWAPDIIQNYESPRMVRDSTYAYIYVFGERPIYEYPVGPSTIVGINDTIQVAIIFQSEYGKEYSLAGKKPEEWFAPEVYDVEADIFHNSPLYDSSQLGYRYDGWRKGYEPVQMPDKLDKYDYYSLIMEVWDVPEGTYRLVVRPTEKVPSDFARRTFSNPYFYWHAKVLADSINAWNELFFRALADSNKVLAKQWLDSIQAHNHASFTGYALAARYYRMEDDSAKIVDAYDAAIATLKNFDDPALPDTSVPWDNYAYKRWYEYYLDRMVLEQDRYMNEPETRGWFDYWR